ncbi:uncharacterized protein CMU_024590 [Cryptosporidium muris RN66]|uniref:Uncharacterized protein n=1 Tax=Cryptosporidium muris (strain RN66) TaxID=441375 RepID=B6AAQ1_CRYMR|nr:uncharacterized protein CMU_024590 [Cryptosporidium muris RN66]EEA05453.1 hypothetical protein CMU_024590 [Cryptosporidium muris RN66]|eukprot:XP_002139802.1 hypothetical protein [Cryptosporidium muris RN66]
MRNKGLKYQEQLLNCEVGANNNTSSTLYTNCKKLTEKILKVHIYLSELKMEYEKLNEKLILYKHISESEDSNIVPRENLGLDSYYDNEQNDDIFSQTKSRNIPLFPLSSNCPLDGDNRYKAKEEIIKEIMKLGESVKSILKPAKERSLRQIEEKSKQMKSKQDENLSIRSRPVSTSNKMRVKFLNDITLSTSNLNSMNIDSNNNEESSNDSLKGNIDTSSYLDNMNLRKIRKKRGISRADIKKISDILDS